MDKELQQELYNEIVGTLNDHTDIMGTLEIEQTAMCRICLQCDSNSALITPCHCSGSVRYVHEECLKAWLLSKGSVDNNSCELCHSPFVMHFKLGKKCSPGSLFSLESNSCLLLGFAGLLLTILCAVIIILLNRYETPGQTETQQRYILVILGICGVLGLTILANLFAITVKSCIKSQLVYWKIESQETDEVVCLGESGELPAIEDFEVPPTVLFRGKPIETPKLSVLSPTARRWKPATPKGGTGFFVFSPRGRHPSHRSWNPQ